MVGWSCKKSRWFDSFLFGLSRFKGGVLIFSEPFLKFGVIKKKTITFFIIVIIYI